MRHRSLFVPAVGHNNNNNNGMTENNNNNNNASSGDEGSPTAHSTLNGTSNVVVDDVDDDDKNHGTRGSGSGNNFSYGTAVRGGLSSFFTSYAPSAFVQSQENRQNQQQQQNHHQNHHQNQQSTVAPPASLLLLRIDDADIAAGQRKRSSSSASSLIDLDNNKNNNKNGHPHNHPQDEENEMDDNDDVNDEEQGREGEGSNKKLNEQQALCKRSIVGSSTGSAVPVGPPPPSSGYSTSVASSCGDERGRSMSSSSNLSIQQAPSSANSASTINENHGHPNDLEIFDDMVSEPLSEPVTTVLVLGYDITHLPRQTQFAVCASGVFFFSLLYGYLQELISVEICNRQLGLFLAMMQFVGYTALAYVLRNFVYNKELAQQQEKLMLHQDKKKKQQIQQQIQQQHQRSSTRTIPQGTKDVSSNNNNHNSATASLLSVSSSTSNSKVNAASVAATTVPFLLYLGLSLLRAVDLAMTNLAMQYINYPAKTLMKSSRVVFTMVFGAIIARKRYHTADYLIVLAMVIGLALFMHADANSSAVFDPMGVLMLTISLICDGAISNISETIMSKFGVGQDEFIFRMYSIALIAITAAAAVNGDLYEGMTWMFQKGTYNELALPVEERTWTVMGKFTVMVLFSSMGFFGSSCSAAITKNFGALTMSITSTARKATTLFLSFLLFNNVCTVEHLCGMIVFIAALLTKSLRRGRKSSSSKRKHESADRPSRTVIGDDGIGNTSSWSRAAARRRKRRQQHLQQTKQQFEEGGVSDGGTGSNNNNNTKHNVNGNRGVGGVLPLLVLHSSANKDNAATGKNYGSAAANRGHFLIRRSPSSPETSATNLSSSMSSTTPAASSAMMTMTTTTKRNSLPPRALSGGLGPMVV